ncbi:MAG: hypothetical protein HFH72_16870 [Lachnospiraceae bacterium]|nr:hypothetical protein [Lachnospiraceae bacterium]
MYEIIEDYKESNTEEEKDEIFHSFCSSIWSSDNKRRIYKKSIRFNVRKDLLQTELGQVFNTWSEIEYTYYKSMTRDENWHSIIRQKINNIYTRYFDKEVILGKEYMDLLKTPKKLYYQWISGIDMDAETVTEIIDNAIENAAKIKIKLQKEKMSLSWNEYKKVVEEFLRKCFDNCKLIGEYEDKAKIVTMLNFLTEDNFYVKYVCKSLEGEILKWQKKYYGVRDHKKYSRCKQCGAIIEKTGNKRLYCEKCAREKELERYRKYNQKRITTNRKV